jgi:hypothetical protein
VKKHKNHNKKPATKGTGTSAAPAAPATPQK